MLKVLVQAWAHTCQTEKRGIGFVSWLLSILLSEVVLSLVFVRVMDFTNYAICLGHREGNCVKITKTTQRGGESIVTVLKQF